MSIWSLLTYQQSGFKHYHSDTHLSQFYLQDGGKNSLGIDMEQNYVTDILCIPNVCGTTMPRRERKFNTKRYRRNAEAASKIIVLARRLNCMSLRR